MQYAVATYAVTSLHKKPKQLWQILAGQGKSRIIATAAIYALTERDFQNVHIVYPSKHLMVRDKETYTQQIDLVDCEEKVHYHEDLEFETNKGDLVIIDEVDYFIYSDPKAFYKFQVTRKIIGFTATASTKAIKGLEHSVF